MHNRSSSIAFALLLLLFGVQVLIHTFALNALNGVVLLVIGLYLMTHKA
jgi:hypothetical protein